MRPLIVILAALLATSASVHVASAGDAGKAFRDGNTFMKSGRDFKAATAFVETLQANGRHKKALEYLREIAEAAYEEKLEEAQDKEGAKDHGGALTAYKDLYRFLKDAKEFDAVTFSTIDVRAKVAEMANSAAEGFYVKAERAFADAQWQQAVALYRSAETYRADYKDCGEKIETAFYRWAEADLAAARFDDAISHFVEATHEGDKTDAKRRIAPAYYAWAEADLAATRYRDAIDHFLGAARKGDQTDAQRRAAAIQHSLGLYHLSKGACRKALVDLKAALDMLGSPTTADAVEQARACAVTPVAMPPVENPTGVNPAGMAIGDLLADGIMSATRSRASEFLTVIERTSLDAIFAEQGISGVSSSSTPKGVKGVRYLLLGKITQLTRTRPSPASRTLATTAERRFPCVKSNSDGSTYQTQCSAEMTVNYQEVSASASIRVVLSLRAVDVATGRQVGMESIESQAGDSVKYGENFRYANGDPAPIARTTQAGIFQVSDGDGVISSTLSQLADARRDLATDDALMQKILDEIYGRAGHLVIRWLDSPADAHDPGTLSIVTL